MDARFSLRSPRLLPASVFAGSLAAVVLVACAQGGSAPDLSSGAAPAGATDTTEPGAPGATLPSGSSGTSGTSGDDGGGGTSSGGTSSGGTSSGGTSSSGGIDAGTDAAVDAGTDAGGGGTCAKTAPSNLCGLAPQCGCATNETCDVTNAATGAVSCVLAGGGPQGSYCTSTNQCEKGLTCAYNTCRPYCGGAVGSACTGAGLGVCEQWYSPPGTAVTNGTVCSIPCDLRSPTAACGSNTCVWDPSLHASDCDKAGAGALYDACAAYNDCGQGLACVNHPVFGYECEKWCRIGQNDCGLLETCTDVYGADAPTVGGTKLGHCQ